MQTVNKMFIQKLKTGTESDLVSVIFNNLENVKIRKSLEISTKFNTKTLCTFFFSPQKSLKALQLINEIIAWHEINHSYHNYISCLELVL